MSASELLFINVFAISIAAAICVYVHYMYKYSGDDKKKHK